MNVSLPLFIQLAASCAPGVHVDTLAAIARTESGFHAHAIHDNTDGRRYLAATRGEAIAIATDLISAKRHSVDLGLMQVNSANLASLGMTIAQVFDPCQSISAGARVLATGYKPPPAGQDTQPALLQALSRYNTGHPARGFANGYVAKVVASAEQVAPAIRLGESGVPRPEDRKRVAPVEPSPAAPSPPPTWDVFGRARYAREQVYSRVPAPVPLSSSPQSQPPVQRQPVQLRATRQEVSDAR